MALPPEVTPRTQEQWLELANHQDPQQRRIVSDALRKIGHDPTAFVSWKPTDRVAKIMEAQGDAPAAVKTAAPAAAAAAPANANGAAGPATTTAAAAAPAGGKTPAASKATAAPATVDLGPVTSRLDQLAALAATQAQEIATLRAQATEMQTYVRDMHMMVQLFFATNADAKANLDDPDMRVAFYGRLAHPEATSGNG